MPSFHKMVLALGLTPILGAIISCHDPSITNSDSTYPRDFLLLADDGYIEAHGTSWARDGFFNQNEGEEEMRLFTTFSGDYAEIPDLWGPSAIAYAEIERSTGGATDYFYITGEMSYTLGVLERGAFNDPDPTYGDYAEKLADGSASIYRGSQFRDAGDMTSVLAHPTDVAALVVKEADFVNEAVTKTEDIAFLFVAARGGNQVSVFVHRKGTPLSYVGSVSLGNDHPSKLKVFEARYPDPGRDTYDCANTPTEDDLCTFRVVLTTIADNDASLTSDSREDRLYVHSLDLKLQNDKKSYRLSVSSEFDSSTECSGTDVLPAAYCDSLNGLWGLEVDESYWPTSFEIFTTNRADNKVVHLKMGAISTGSTVTVANTVRDYAIYTAAYSDTSLSYDRLVANCDSKKPANLGFKGLAVTTKSVFATSWQTGYIFAWPRATTFASTSTSTSAPKVTCALAGKCGLKFCGDSSEDYYAQNNWYALNDRAKTNSDSDLRPHPYALEVYPNIGTRKNLFFTMDRNGKMATCDIDESKDGRSPVFDVQVPADLPYDATNKHYTLCMNAKQTLTADAGLIWSSDNPSVLQTRVANNSDDPAKVDVKVYGVTASNPTATLVATNAATRTSQAFVFKINDENDPSCESNGSNSVDSVGPCTALDDGNNCTLTMKPGETIQLRAISDDNKLLSNLDWAVQESSDPTITPPDISISSSGLLTAGTVEGTITVQPEPGNAKSITIEISSEAQDFVAGVTLDLLAETPATVTPESIASTVWSSTEPDVLTVDDTGKPTSHRAGSATIIVTADATVSTETTPYDSFAVSTLLPIDLSPLMVDETYQIASTTTSAVTWSTSAEANATVDSVRGLVTGKAEGFVIINETATNTSTDSSNASTPPSKTYTYFAVTESPFGLGKSNRLTACDEWATKEDGDDTEDSSMLVTSIMVSGSNKLLIGESIQFDKTVEPSDATDSSVTWESGNPSIATVSNNGLVTGVAGGTLTIFAHAADRSGISGSFDVTVEQPVTGITVNGTATVEIGGDTQLTPHVVPADAADKSITWTSDHEDIATVNISGLVTGVAEGTAIITATAVDGSGVAGTLVVTVNAATD